MAFPRVHADGQKDEECDGDHLAEVGEEHEQDHEQVRAYDGLGGDVFVVHNFRGSMSVCLSAGRNRTSPVHRVRLCVCLELRSVHQFRVAHDPCFLQEGQSLIDADA